MEIDEINYGAAILAILAGILAFFIAGYSGYGGFFGRIITALIAMAISYFIVERGA